MEKNNVIYYLKNRKKIIPTLSSCKFQFQLNETDKSYLVLQAIWFETVNTDIFDTNL